jgi:hypothetical protein
MCYDHSCFRKYSVFTGQMLALFYSCFNSFGFRSYVIFNWIVLACVCVLLSALFLFSFVYVFFFPSVRVTYVFFVSVLYGQDVNKQLNNDVIVVSFFPVFIRYSIRFSAGYYSTRRSTPKICNLQLKMYLEWGLWIATKMLLTPNMNTA